MPKIPDIRLRLAVGAAFAAWFWTVYLGCDAIAHGFTHRYDVATPLDAMLPFVPQLASAYMGVNVMLVAPLVVIRDTARLLALAAALTVEVAIAGLVFLVFPTEPSITPAGHGSAILEAADLVNLTYNGFPSLHVALTVSTGAAMMRDLPPFWRVVLAVAAAAIVVSTMLTRQHFVADVLAGLVLAAAVMATVYPMVRRMAVLRLA